MSLTFGNLKTFKITSFLLYNFTIQQYFVHNKNFKLMGPYWAITDQNTVKDNKLEHVEPLPPPAKTD
jgi:uncharacterized protein affecting Mg2+/Co2+ transport